MLGWVFTPIDGAVRGAGLWQLWDSVEIASMQMQGWWEPGCPVRMRGCENVVATVYNRSGIALVAVASWHHSNASCAFEIDWQALGLAPGPLEAPFVDLGSDGIDGAPMTQRKRTLSASEPFRVEPRGGALLVLRGGLAPAPE